MRNYNGQKVLYYDHQAMLRVAPLKWLIYVAIALSGLVISVVIDIQFPGLLDTGLRRWISRAFILLTLLAGVAVYARWWIESYKERLVLTPTDAIVLEGILNVQATDIRLANIQTVRVDQTLWDRVVGLGTVRISTAGEEGFGINMPGMPSPKKIRRIIVDGRAGQLDGNGD